MVFESLTLVFISTQHQNPTEILHLHPNYPRCRRMRISLQASRNRLGTIIKCKRKLRGSWGILDPDDGSA